MVTIFEFEITGNEVLSNYAFNRRSSILYQIEETKRYLTQNKKRIEKTKHSLDSTEQTIVDDYKKLDENLAALENEISKEINFSSDWVKNYRIPLGNSAFETFLLPTIKSSATLNNYRKAKKEVDSFYQENKKVISRVEDLEQRRKQTIIESEDSKKKYQYLQFQLEQIEKDTPKRISDIEMVRLNEYIGEMNSKGWIVKSIQALTTGYADSFGQQSELSSYGGTVYPSGGYGCSFTHGLIILWEKK